MTCGSARAKGSLVMMDSSLSPVPRLTGRQATGVAIRSWRIVTATSGFLPTGGVSRFDPPDRFALDGVRGRLSRHLGADGGRPPVQPVLQAQGRQAQDRPGRTTRLSTGWRTMACGHCSWIETEPCGRVATEGSAGSIRPRLGEIQRGSPKLLDSRNRSGVFTSRDRVTCGSSDPSFRY